MIRYIKVKNFSLIKDIEVELDSRLNVIYGESGSGKSLLLSSLYILIGGKSSPDLIREGEEKAILECEIEGIGIIQKVIGKSRSIQSIDGENLTLTSLKEKLTGLIENFTQGEQEEIYTRDYQIDFINLFIEDKTLLSRFQTGYKEFMEKTADLENYIKRVQEEKSKKEFYDYQLNEIEALNLQDVNEEVELDKMINLHVSKENIILESDNLLNEFHLLESNVSKINSTIIKLSTKYKIELQVLDMEELGLSQYISKVKDELYSQTLDYTDLENYSLDDLNNRLYRIQKLKKRLGKYNLEDIIKFRTELQEILKNLEDSEEEINTKKSEILRLGKELEQLANTLADQQKEVIINLIPKLSLILNSLGFEYVNIEDKWTILSSITAKGNKIPELYVSFNRGFETKPIRKIVSGGEASRLALAFKMLSGNKNILILDEIDTGLSGDSLNSMANVLKSMDSQIICVTHSKEIINCGNKKIKVYKEEVNEKTETKLETR